MGSSQKEKSEGSVVPVPRPPAECYPACVTHVTGPCCMMSIQWDGRRCLMG
ncbi:hypothetical protein DPMN_056699 [Dreissena polymorpha]|uniref:Uncharacterized protein n=1 Tax=Dreissena polymorpha TaxID=45954 RepID=A0A9D4HRR6_DREPO|nr:hypothetical protein DPMN_056699 [Dreissena polymorpha]